MVPNSSTAITPGSLSSSGRPSEPCASAQLHSRPDAFQKVIVAQLAPAGYKLDWTGFYGAGGGGELALTKHIGVRMQLDAVYNHPFNDILANGRWTFRSSVGTSFHFGRNTAAGK